MLLFQVGDARKGRTDAQHLRVAREDAGDERIGQHFRRLAARAAAHERRNRFVVRRPVPSAQRFGEETELAAPGQEWTAQEGTETTGQGVEFAFEVEKAVPCRGVAAGNQPVGQANFATESQGRRL